MESTEASATSQVGTPLYVRGVNTRDSVRPRLWVPPTSGLALVDTETTWQPTEQKLSGPPLMVHVPDLLYTNMEHAPGQKSAPLDIPDPDIAWQPLENCQADIRRYLLATGNSGATIPGTDLWSAIQ
jgi:hypothetical protein